LTPPFKLNALAILCVRQREPLLFQKTQQYNNVQLLEDTTKKGKRMRKNHVKAKLKRGEASLVAR
jgi:hypothetical protein